MSFSPGRHGISQDRPVTPGYYPVPSIAYAPREAKSVAQPRGGKKKNRATAVIITFLLGNLILGFTTSAVSLIQLRQKEKQIQAEISRIQDENGKLQKEIAFLKSPAYVEKVAREELGLVKPDEVKYVVAQPISPDDPWNKDVQRRPGADQNQSYY